MPQVRCSAQCFVFLSSLLSVPRLKQRKRDVSLKDLSHSAAMGNFSAAGHSFFSLFPDYFWEREGSGNDSSAHGSEGKLHMCRKKLIWPQWTEFTKTWAFAHSPEWLEKKAVVVHKKNLESCPKLWSVGFPSAVTHHHHHGTDLSYACWKVQTDCLWYLLVHSNKTSDQENRIMTCI